MDSNQSILSVANAALGKCGVAIIQSLTPPDPNSKGAIRVAQCYYQLLDYCLAQHPWTFAKNTVALQTLSIPVPVFGDGVSIAYAYPSDWIKPNLWNFAYAIKRLEAAAIFSDTPGLMVKYTFRNLNPATYTPEFIEFLATKIAAEVCYDLTNNVQLAAQLAKQVDEKKWQAIASDSQGDTPDQPQADEWFIARLSGAQSAVVQPGTVSWSGTGTI